MSILRGQRVSRRAVLAGAASAASVTALGVSVTPSMAQAAAPAGFGHGHGRTDPDFGPNVFVFDGDTPAADIQAKFDELFEKQKSNEMGTDRYAVLFKPGAYNVVAKL